MNKLAEAISEALELIALKEGWLSDDSMKALTEYLEGNQMKCNKESAMDV